MKYIKTYENIKEPQIGHFVICSYYPDRVAEVIDIEDETNLTLKTFSIQATSKDGYKWRPKSLSINSIEYWSSNKEDCEEYLMAKKYNL